MRKLIATGILALGTPASAEVKSSSGVGFEVQSSVTVPAAPAASYAMLGRIGEWWDPAHSYSGKGANLRLGLKAGDCFCERLDDGGSVEHMRVVQARPGSLLRLQGGLGPLQGEAVAGTLTWSLKPVAGGTQITQSYVVGGYVRGGAEKWAAPVDQVLSGQLQRLAKGLGPGGN